MALLDRVLSQDEIKDMVNEDMLLTALKSLGMIKDNVVDVVFETETDVEEQSEAFENNVLVFNKSFKKQKNVFEIKYKDQNDEIGHNFTNKQNIINNDLGWAS